MRRHSKLETFGHVRTTCSPGSPPAWSIGIYFFCSRLGASGADCICSEGAAEQVRGTISEHIEVKEWLENVPVRCRLPKGRLAGPVVLLEMKGSDWTLIDCC